MEQTKPTEQTSISQDWLKQELKAIDEKKFDGERLPSITLEENKITVFEVVYDKVKEFDKWIDEKGNIKKIIPVMHDGQKKNFWLNVRNPLYADIIRTLAEGKTLFKVLRSGQKENTRYTMIKE